MTIVNGYCTLIQLKHKMRLDIADSDTSYDSELEGIIEDASRDIDDSCHRFFYTDADSDDPQSFYYTARSTNQLFIDDVRTLTHFALAIDLIGDGVTYTEMDSDDYILEPSNAVALGEPFQKIVLRDTASQVFTKGLVNGVKVTAHFGWPSVPKPIQQASLLWAERTNKRFATPLGSESMTALGRMSLTIPDNDPDVMRKIGRYIKPSFG